MPLDGSERSVMDGGLGKTANIIIKQKAGWVRELAWTLWKDKPLAPAGK